jgi:poly-gamma-glutamate synthesis protein (capsule biosynthesis protein)
VLLVAAATSAVACRYQPKLTTGVLAAATVTTTSTTAVTVPSTTAAPPVPTGTRWRLFAAGDVKIDPDDASGDPLGSVRPRLSEADVSLVNVEMAIGDPTTAGTAASKSYTFLGAPAAPAILARAGVDVVGLANNHSLDYGPATLLDTIDRLRSAGAETVGAGRNDAAAYRAVIKPVAAAVRVAIVAASAVYPEPTWAAAVARPGVASGYNVARFAAAVREARRQAEVVIAFVHWGEETSPCPNDSQRALAAALRKAGAVAVLGSHPHVLQPLVQEATMTDAPGVVAYSLGNFMFDRRTGPAGDTIVLELVFDGARLVDVKAHPHLLQSGRPRPAAAGTPAAARIAAALANPCIPN